MTGWTGPAELNETVAVVLVATDSLEKLEETTTCVLTGGGGGRK